MFQKMKLRRSKRLSISMHSKFFNLVETYYEEAFCSKNLHMIPAYLSDCMLSGKLVSLVSELNSSHM